MCRPRLLRRFRVGFLNIEYSTPAGIHRRDIFVFRRDSAQPDDGQRGSGKSSRGYPVHDLRTHSNTPPDPIFLVVISQRMCYNQVTQKTRRAIS